MIRQNRDTAVRTAAVNAAPGRALALVGKLGRALAGSGLLPAKTLAELQLSLNAAGLRGGGGLGVFIGSKVLLLAGLGALGLLLSRRFVTSPMLSIAMPLGGAMMGMLLPDFYLRQMRARHLKQVEAGLPDALDMLVICTEAGLGLEAGIDRVASEIRPAHPAIAEEFQITGTELRIIADRRQVLLDMGARTNLDSLRRLAATLIQTTQFGTPLSQALRVLATEMRVEMLTRFEARAAKLPVYLTIPMIVFILPCIFIIVGGPAALQLSTVLGKK
jgi:tight adherence protein C